VLTALPDKPDWLIVDHYGLDARWEAAMRPLANRILVIDDLADRPHDCDLFLDHNLVDNMLVRYEGKLPPHCPVMFGPRYALLQPLYAVLRASTCPKEGPIQRILISFGGAEPGILSSLALQAVLNMNRADIKVDIVVNAEAMKEISSRGLGSGDNVCVHSNLPSLAPLLAHADIAIGTAGTSTWERLSLGIPTLVITVAENQRAVAASLHRRGLVNWLGHQGEVDLARLENALRAAIERGNDGTISRLCRAVVDGRGVERTVAAMTLDEHTSLVLRDVVAADEALLLDWANDPVTRMNSFRAHHIADDEHRAWFLSRLNDMGKCRMFIVETTRGIPVGQVRFERNGETWEINYSVGPPYRARGIGRTALELALMKLRSSEVGAAVVGRVTRTNLASQRIFRSLGFQQVLRAAGDIEYRLTL
jgi:UDP-2,4-diacetamido-2,4,6-trideoxy-beta-L-altropyranose hydrolase